MPPPYRESAAPRALEDLLPPPRAPVRTPVDWQKVARELGTDVPSDYKAFVARYGVGEVDGFLSVFHPSVNLVVQRDARLEALRELREPPPFPAFPSAGGLLPWGCTDNGAVLYWRTLSTHPDGGWSVVLHDARFTKWVEFPGSMTEFLVAVLSRELRPGVFPAEFPSDSPQFEIWPWVPASDFVVADPSEAKAIDATVGRNRWPAYKCVRITARDLAWLHFVITRADPDAAALATYSALECLVDTGQSWVERVPDSLLEEIGSVTDLRATARRWAACEEMEDADLEDLVRLLAQLRRLSGLARANDKALLLWTSL